MSWLLEHQNPTGSWGSNPRLEQLTTATVVQALRAAGVDVTQVRRAEAWLLGGVPTVTGDVSQTLLALATSELPVETAGVAADLASRQVRPVAAVFDFDENSGRTLDHATLTLGEDVGWGIGPGQRANLADTAGALQALDVAGAAIPNQALAEQQLEQGQTPTGPNAGGWPLVRTISAVAIPSWPVTPGDPASEVSTTASVLIALGRIASGNPTLLAIASDGVSWLLTQPNGDGGFGAGGVSTPAETALAYRALRAFGVAATDPALSGVIDPSGGYLLDTQEQNTLSPDFGSWNGQAYATALALHALEDSGIAVDTDGDGVPDSIDPNDDNDAELDENDAFPLDATETADQDGDGIGDGADPDRDGDGFCDTPIDVAAGYCPALDAYPDDGNAHADSDGDGIADAYDPDTDGDTVLDVVDLFPLDAGESTDLDGDGIGDEADSDRDGDGYCDDAEEALAGGCTGIDLYPDDPSEALDSDGDGIADNADPDDDNDGWEDVDELVAGSDPLDDTSVPSAPDPGLDTDGDGLLNYAEDVLLTSPFRVDTDGDGATDRIEFEVGTDPRDAGSQPAPVVSALSAVSPAPAATVTGGTLETSGSGGLSTPSGSAEGAAGGFVNQAGFQPQTLLARDGDGDGLIGFEESAQDTSLTNVDSDGDGFADGPGGVVDVAQLPGGYDLDGDLKVDGELDVGTDPSDGADHPGEPGDVAPLGLPDGQVDAADLAVHLRILRDPSLASGLPGHAAALTVEASDVNQDGEANLGDSVLVLKQVTNGQ